MASNFRLLTYASKDGDRAGLLVDKTVLDLESALGSWSRSTKRKAPFDGKTVRDVLANWTKAKPILNAIAKRGAARGVKSQPLSKTRLRAPIPDLGMIWCAGANYYDHTREMTGREPDKSKIEPFFFIKAGGTTVVGDKDTVKLPKYSKQVDWEAELAVIIGKPARNVKKKDALKYVAGYTIYNDLSLRDRGTRDDWPFRFDWLRQKSFDTGGPMGPWITPADNIKDPQKLKVDLWVNKTYEQDTNTDQMIFTIAEQIEALSKQITLMPGDVITTGTGAGCGRPKNKYLKAGDKMTITIENLGTIVNPVRAGA